MKYILCIIYLIFSLLGLSFMKLGSMDGRRVIFQLLQIKFTIQSIIGYFFYMASFFIYTFIITKFDLSYIIPLLGGIVNILIFGIGFFLFQEKATVYSIVGCLLIISGVFLMNMK